MCPSVGHQAQKRTRPESCPRKEYDSGRSALTASLHAKLAEGKAHLGAVVDAAEKKAGAKVAVQAPTDSTVLIVGDDLVRGGDHRTASARCF